MRTLQSNRARPGFTLIEILIVVVILGVLASIVIPQFASASQEASTSNIASQLRTLRTQIALYNVQHQATVYDAATVVDGTFWDALYENTYLQTLPKNPLQGNSTRVTNGPGAGFGWIWAEATAGDSWTLNIYALDENGAWFDGDGDGLPD